MQRIYQLAKRFLARRSLSSGEYWTAKNVTAHHQFASAEESLEYFHWRNDCYFGYIELLPVAGRDGEVVLDYGCGPGHDLVGLGHYSQPARLIGMDVSPTSLAESAARLKLHGIEAELIRIDENDPRLPLDEASVDYVHSSGVIHHTPDPAGVLGELRRVIKPTGECRVMVYNYDSLFLHLYVAYINQVRAGRYANQPIREAFSRLTDGKYCPISRVYRPEEFVELSRQSGFTAEHIGNAVSMAEMAALPQRFAAVQDRRLPREHREFLLALRFDEFGYPLYHDVHAGVDGCYRLRPS